MAKKSPNSNRTAHVMNLLSRGRGPAQDEAQDQAPQEDTPAAAPAKTEAPAASPVNELMSSLHPDATVSAQIKNALEADLEGQPAPARAPAPDLSAEEAEARQDDPEQPEEPARQEEAAQPVVQSAQEALPSFDPEEEEVVPAEEPAEEAAPPQPQPAPVQQAQPQPVQPSAQPAAAQPAAKPEDPPQFHDLIYVNVMQQLVEEAAPKYMRLYGVCTCPRCQVDVKALALCGLPSKYVVMRQGEMVPRISVYEGRYSAAVTAQLLWACKLVSEKPHHGR